MHLGEVRTMNNGSVGTIIRYGNYKDIDVSFGEYIIRGIRYESFKKGELRGYELSSRVGETNIANNGMLMTIIAYRSYRDIDIEFEDGFVVYNKCYASFKSGYIKNPNKKADKTIKSRVGETNIANNGMLMTIIAYRSCTDIDIKFEDGTIVKNKSYGEFKKGQVRNTNIRQGMVSRIGESKLMNCGLYAEIIDYNSSVDMTVRFSNDVVRNNVRYLDFKKGILKPTKRSIIRLKVGDEFTSNSGLHYIIVKRLENRRALVRFDDGVEHDYNISNILIGAIAHPSQSLFKREKSSYIGETSRHTSGELMTIIAYRSCTDIDIKFEDGTIVYGKAYGSFKTGEIAKISNKELSDIRIGEENIAKNGLRMTIIAYRSSTDIDIKFEDNVIVTNKRYKPFLDGEIAHPNYTKIKSRVGEYVYNNNGLGMKVTRYRNNKDIDVLCDDGTEFLGVGYRTFITGNLAHKGLKNYNGSVQQGYLFAHFQVTKLAYRGTLPQDVFYICQCQKCGYKDILTPSEMLEHKCDN